MTADVSVQLYSLREEAVLDFRAVLERLGRIGFVGVETAGFHGLTAAEVRRTLDDAGLVASLGSRAALLHVKDGPRATRRRPWWPSATARSTLRACSRPRPRPRGTSSSSTDVIPTCSTRSSGAITTSWSTRCRGAGHE